MTRTFCVAEALETRTLMSATATNAALSMAVQNDRLAVHIDLLNFRADCLYGSAKMLGDMAALKGDHLHDEPTVGPLITTMRSDLKAMHLALLEDRLNESSNVLADELGIVGDLKQKLVDKGTSAEAADQAKLMSDRIKMQDDMVAGLTQRLNDRESYSQTIGIDAQNIATALQSDTGLSTKAAADVSKWTTDRTACMKAITADVSKLLADRSQLVADLTALQAA